MLKREQVQQFYQSQGYTLDRFGHLKKDSEGKTYRVVLNAKAVRFEVKCEHEHGPATWIRLRSGYYGNLTINNGEILGMTR